MPFADRRDAGRRLAADLAPLADERPLVLALPRGGVPVAAEVARALGAPLDVLAVRKLGAPGNAELAVGAIAEDGSALVDRGIAQRTGMTRERFEETLAREERELRRRVTAYREGRSPPDVRGRTTIIIDDGLATGLTALVAVEAVRRRGAARVVLAAPVGSEDAVARLREAADDVVCPLIPPDFRGVGSWYEDFSPVRDVEVLTTLAAARAGPGAPDEREAHVADAAERAVQIRAGGAELLGDLVVPAHAHGLVVFAHGSGSSRHSPRNRAVAQTLQRRGLATLLLDLLTEREQGDRRLVFDIAFLASRLEAAIAWARAQDAVGTLPLGLFGASTGAAAALVAAARLGDVVAAVVSRGGRPDLAADVLPVVTAPTLLVVGGADQEVLALNRRAAASLHGAHRVVVVDGAGHLFEESGALEQVADLAADWFGAHLRRGATAPHGPGAAAGPGAP